MSNTGIPYLTRGWNFLPGCEHQKTGVCPVPHCWARDMNKRFHGGDFTPRLLPEKLLEPLSWRKPQRVGVCFTGDLFGDWVNPFATVRAIATPKPDCSCYDQPLRDYVFSTIRLCPQHTFLFLTKAPWNLYKWSPFPDNAWVGTSVCNQKMLPDAIHGLSDVLTRIAFISFEPLMLPIDFTHARLYGIQWVIIGGFSRYSPKTAPKIEWIRAIIQEADRVGAKVYLKDNLSRILVPDDCRQPNALNDDIFWASEKAQLRQELPE